MGPNQIKRITNSQLFDYRDRLSIPKNSFLSYLSNDYVFASIVMMMNLKSGLNRIFLITIGIFLSVLIYYINHFLE